MSNKYHITNETAVDRFCAVKLADLCYQPGSTRPDDCGALYVAPITSATWDAPLGTLLVYATTNGDPIQIGQIEDGELALFELDESLVDALRAAIWAHPDGGEGYSYLVCDSIADTATR